MRMEYSINSMKVLGVLTKETQELCYYKKGYLGDGNDSPQVHIVLGQW